MRNFITAFGDKFNIGEVQHGPGRLRFFRLNIVQDEGFVNTIDVDEKIQSIEPYPLSRVRRRQRGELMN